MTETCSHTLKFGSMLLTCDLHLIVHKIHHDPVGLWWTECTLHCRH